MWLGRNRKCVPFVVRFMPSMKSCVGHKIPCALMYFIEVVCNSGSGRVTIFVHSVVPMITMPISGSNKNSNLVVPTIQRGTLQRGYRMIQWSLLSSGQHEAIKSRRNALKAATWFLLKGLKHHALTRILIFWRMYEVGSTFCNAAGCLSLRKEESKWRVS